MPQNLFLNPFEPEQNFFSHLEVNSFHTETIHFQQQRPSVHLQLNPSLQLASHRGRPAGVRGRSAEIRGRPAEIRGRPAEIRGRPAEVRGRPAEIRGRPAEVRGRPAEVRGRPTEVRDRPRRTRPILALPGRHIHAFQHLKKIGM